MPVLLRSCVDSDPVTRTSGKALGFSMLESRLSFDMMVAGAGRKSLRQSALCLASDGNFSAILPKHYKINRIHAHYDLSIRAIDFFSVLVLRAVFPIFSTGYS